MQQETYVPMTVVRPVYMPVPRVHKRCYTERPVYVNGIVYPGNRICEQQLAASPTAWVAPDNGLGYYRVHRHHLTYKYY